MTAADGTARRSRRVDMGGLRRLLERRVGPTQHVPRLIDLVSAPWQGALTALRYGSRLSASLVLVQLSVFLVGHDS
jgi:hypothetical protein